MEKDSKKQFRTTRGYLLAKKGEQGITSSMEDYLEMICRLCKQDGYTRVGKVSAQLHVQPSSASKMIGKLMEQGYINYDGNSNIQLAEKGEELSAYLLKRHEVLDAFLQFLEIEDPLQEVELLEHYVSLGTVIGVENLLAFFHIEENKKAWQLFLKESENLP